MVKKTSQETSIFHESFINDKFAIWYYCGNHVRNFDIISGELLIWTSVLTWNTRNRFAVKLFREIISRICQINYNTSLSLFLSIIFIRQAQETFYFAGAVTYFHKEINPRYAKIWRTSNSLPCHSGNNIVLAFSFLSLSFSSSCLSRHITLNLFPRDYPSTPSFRLNAKVSTAHSFISHISQASENYFYNRYRMNNTYIRADRETDADN